jgi:hypothetical protein
VDSGGDNEYYLPNSIQRRFGLMRLRARLEDGKRIVDERFMDGNRDRMVEIFCLSICRQLL